MQQTATAALGAAVTPVLPLAFPRASMAGQSEAPQVLVLGAGLAGLAAAYELGKQGLINAYKTTAELVIAESALFKWVSKSQFRIISSVKYFGKIAHIVHQNDGKIINDQTTDKLNLIIELPIEMYNGFKTEFDEITQNSGIIKKQSEHDQTKEVRK
ncbi:MAG: hypothetical protein V3S42_00015 [Candidatus Neomarinimicrobiota bacterium]